VQKFRAILAIVVGVIALSVPTAFASTTSTIVSDAQDGVLNGTYSTAALQAALSSPESTYLSQGGVEAVRSAIGNQAPRTTSSGTLPFTGAEIATFLALGSGLLVAGFVLRRSSRRDDSPIS
jgi:hypothetical protein